MFFPAETAHLAPGVLVVLGLLTALTQCIEQVLRRGKIRHTLDNEKIIESD